MATRLSNAREYLGLLREIDRRESAMGTGRSFAGGGVGRQTGIALEQIQRNTEEIKRALKPSAAEERSVL